MNKQAQDFWTTLADKLGVPYKDLVNAVKEVVVEMDEEGFFDGNGDQ